MNGAECLTRITNTAHRGGYSLCNIGSSPAMYAFEYMDGEGINLSIGRSCLDMDLEMLKGYSYLLQPHAKVIIPIAPFYSILGNYTETMTQFDIYKYYRVLKHIQAYKESMLESLNGFINTKTIKKYLKYLYHDVEKDTRKFQTEQQYSVEELETNAQNYIKGWLSEFMIDSLDAPLTNENTKRRLESTIHLQRIIDYCNDNHFRPVLVLLPMTEHLLKRMGPDFREIYIYSFLNPVIDSTGVPCINYIEDNRFTDDKYYCNALFLNRTGAKYFTKKILLDIDLILQ